MHVGVMFDDDAKLGMVAVIWPCIVVEGVDRAMSDTAYRAPEEVSKVNDQVWRHAFTLAVDVLRFEHLGSDIDALRVYYGLEFGLEFIAQCLHLVRLYNALWFAALYIEEDACIVPTVTPDLCLAPINLTLVNRGEC